MNTFLMNAWTITIIGGLVVGVVVYLITQGIALRGKASNSEKASIRRRNHWIEVGKEGYIGSGGVVQAGDKDAPDVESGTNRQHDISVHEKGTINAKGDVVAGDTRDSEVRK